MRSHPSTPRRMIAMHVVQGLDFIIAKRGNILHRECSRSGLRFVSIESCSLWYRGYQMSLNSIRKIVSRYLERMDNSRRSRPMQIYRYTVIFEPAEEGGYVVHVPALNGAATQGETLEEAREMAKDLIIGYLEALAKDGTPAPVEDLEPLTEPVREVLEVVVD